MTAPRRFQEDLPALLGELYVTGTPDYRDDLFRQTARTRQRPAWSFPERWIPMDIVTQRVATPRAPWRTIAVALLILALVAAGAIYVGSQTTRLPAPFGPARNGVIAYSAEGDILIADTTSGDVTTVVGGPELDRRPAFSPDGTRLAFLRERPDAPAHFDLVVAAKDGSGQTVLTPDSITTDSVIEWAPDGTYLIVTESDGLVRYDSTGKAAPIVIATDVNVFSGAFRPPEGRQILVELDTADTTALYVMDADGSNRRLLTERPAVGKPGSLTANARWSPDGTMVAFGLVGPTDIESRIHVMNADGTGLRQAGEERGTWAADGVASAWVENDLVWSPDSTRLAFNRWEKDKFDTWHIRPIGVVNATGGVVRDLGPTPASEGAILEWSPDGTTVASVSGPFVTAPTNGVGERPMLIDAQTGNATKAAWDVASGTSWQRLAP